MERLILQPVDDPFIRWTDVGRSCLRWAQSGLLTNWLKCYRPGSTTAPDEMAINIAVAGTLSSMVLYGDTLDRFILTDRPSTLGDIHNIRSWTQTTFYKFFQDCLAQEKEEAEATMIQVDAVELPRRASTTSIGPTTPDGMVSWCSSGDPPHPHPTLVMEFKALACAGANDLDRWLMQHKGGLAQAIWYLLVCSSTCGTRAGALVINNGFRRVLVDDEDGAILVESRDEAPRAVHFNDCGFGKNDIPLFLATKECTDEEDVLPGTPHFAMWQFLVVGLMAAQAGARKGSCGPPPRELCEDVKFNTTRLANTDEEKKAILRSVHMYQRAARKDVIQLKEQAVAAQPREDQKAARRRKRDNDGKPSPARKYGGPPGGAGGAGGTVCLPDDRPSANTRSASSTTCQQESVANLGAALVEAWRATIVAGETMESRDEGGLKTLDSGLGDITLTTKTTDEGEDLPMEGAEVYWRDQQTAWSIHMMEVLEAKGLLNIKLISSDTMNSRMDRWQAALCATHATERKT